MMQQMALYLQVEQARNDDLQRRLKAFEDRAKKGKVPCDHEGRGASTFHRRRGIEQCSELWPAARRPSSCGPRRSGRLPVRAHDSVALLGTCSCDLDGMSVGKDGAVHHGHALARELLPVSRHAAD